MKRLLKLFVIGFLAFFFLILLFFGSGCNGGWYGGYQDYGNWGSFRQEMLLDELIFQQMQTQHELQMMQMMYPYE